MPHPRPNRCRAGWLPLPISATANNVRTTAMGSGSISMRQGFDRVCVTTRTCGTLDRRSSATGSRRQWPRRPSDRTTRLARLPAARSSWRRPFARRRVLAISLGTPGGFRYGDLGAAKCLAHTLVGLRRVPVVGEARLVLKRICKDRQKLLERAEVAALDGGLDQPFDSMVARNECGI